MALEAAALFHQQDLFGLTINGKHPYSSFSLETLPNNNNNNNNNNITTTPDFLPPYYFKDEIVHANYDNNFVLPTYDSCFLETPQFDYCQFSHDIYNYHEISNLNENDSNNIILANNNSSYTCRDDEVGLSSTSEWGLNSSSPEELGVAPTTTTVVRPRRRRARVEKNKEDIENQRMTHIAVERNRRKQMNEYLNVLRTLMPDSYVQRGDQASIVGGAINFVKELEQNLQSLSAKKHLKEKLSKGSSSSASSSSLPFKEFFTFPQYSSGSRDRDSENDDQMKVGGAMNQPQGGCEGGVAAAEVEVTVVESHANLKIRLQRPPKQLSKLVSGLLSLRLSILHLNVNTADGVVLYTFSLKVEDDSKLSTVDEIAGAVYKLLGRMQEDQATFNC